MSRYKSEQTAYSPLKKKYVPLWQLDTNTMTVTHFNADTQTEEARRTPPISSGIIFISLTVIAQTGFEGSSKRVRSCSILTIWIRKSAMLSPVRWSFGSRQIVVIRKLSSAVMLRKCSVWRTASSIWREKRYLSVWFIFDCLRLCLRVQPFYVALSNIILVIE